MVYYALAFLVMAVLALVLGFFGVIRGAGQISNIALLMSVVLLAASGVAALRRRHLHHH